MAPIVAISSRPICPQHQTISQTPFVLILSKDGFVNCKVVERFPESFLAEISLTRQVAGSSFRR